MKFQLISCAVADRWWDGFKYIEFLEVQIALFGRCLETDKPVAVTFRYVPYLTVDTLPEEVFYTDCEDVDLRPLYGYTTSTRSYKRLYVPSKRKWMAKIKDATLDYHHTLCMQMLLTLGAKPMDVLEVSDCALTTDPLTNVPQEYAVSQRLIANKRPSFPVVVSSETEFKTAPTIMSFDVEAYSYLGDFPDAGNSICIAICYSVQTLAGKVVTEGKLIGEETDVLNSFHEAIIKLDPDLVTGWNVNGFDWPYLLERAKRLQLSSFPYIDRMRHHKVEMTGFFKKPCFSGRVAFDAMHLIKDYKERCSVDHSNKPESYRLDYIARLCLGRGKLDLSIPEMRSCYERGGMHEVASYCLEDARLPLAILQHENVPNMLFQVANLSGATLQQAFKMSNSALVICSMSWAVHKGRYVQDLPKAEKHDKFQGAFVFEPTPGLYSHLGVVDFNSLYPSTIIAYNFCYTTLVKSEEPTQFSETQMPSGDRVRFSTERPGLLPSTLQKFLDERAAIKRRMKMVEGSAQMVLDSRQQAVKTICNSFYGVLGSTMCFALRVIAEAVTARGRDAIQQTQQRLETLGYAVRAMDTDSCFFELPPGIATGDAAELCAGLARDISRELFQDKLRLEYEKQLRPAIIFRKKMYAGWNPEKGEMLIKGLAAKRRDVTPYARETFQRVLSLLCKDGDVARAFDYVEGRFDELMSMNGKPWEGLDLRQFCLTTAVKHLSEYKGTAPVGVRNNLKLPHPHVPGERISFLYYYDKTDPLHNRAKQKNRWIAGNNVDITLPLQLAGQRPELSLDVLHVMKELVTSVEQYFAAVSAPHMTRLRSLYDGSTRVVRLSRGDVGGKSYSVEWLNMSCSGIQLCSQAPDQKEMKNFSCLDDALAEEGILLATQSSFGGMSYLLFADESSAYHYYNINPRLHAVNRPGATTRLFVDFETPRDLYSRTDECVSHSKSVKRLIDGITTMLQAAGIQKYVTFCVENRSRFVPDCDRWKTSFHVYGDVWFEEIELLAPFVTEAARRSKVDARLIDFGVYKSKGLLRVIGSSSAACHTLPLATEAQFYASLTSAPEVVPDVAAQHIKELGIACVDQRAVHFEERPEFVDSTRVAQLLSHHGETVTKLVKTRWGWYGSGSTGRRCLAFGHHHHKVGGNQCFVWARKGKVFYRCLDDEHKKEKFELGEA